MPTPTYIPLANTTLTSAASTVTFSSITQSIYRDLVAVVSANTGSASADLYLRFNGDTTSWNWYMYMAGNGSSASAANSGATSGGGRATAQAFLNTGERNLTVINIFDYRQTNRYKGYLIRSNRANSGVDAFSNTYDSFSAITSISFLCTSSQLFQPGSTFTLFGIEA